MTSKKPGTFKKGDPRINRKGRPKSFDGLRSLAQSIANEAATRASREVVIGGRVLIEQGKQVIVGGKIITVTEAILRAMGNELEPCSSTKIYGGCLTARFQTPWLLRTRPGRI